MSDPKKRFTAELHAEAVGLTNMSGWFRRTKLSSSTAHPSSGGTEARYRADNWLDKPGLSRSRLGGVRQGSGPAIDLVWYVASWAGVSRCRGPSRLICASASSPSLRLAPLAVVANRGLWRGCGDYHRLVCSLLTGREVGPKPMGGRPMLLVRRSSRSPDPADVRGTLTGIPARTVQPAARTRGEHQLCGSYF